MSKEQKPRTPLITVEVPHPDGDDRRMIGEELVARFFNERLEFDTIPNDVVLIARDPNTGRITLKETFTATHWDEVQQFLNDIRHRLSESLRDEFLEYVRMHLEVERIEERDPRDIAAIAKRLGFVEEPRVLSKTDVVVTWLRDTLGLEGRARPIISVSNIARIRLRRGDADARKHLVREARAVMKMWHMLEEV